MTRQEKIDAVVWSVATWDDDALLQYAQHTIRHELEGASDEQVDEEYANNVSDGYIKKQGT